MSDFSACQQLFMREFSKIKESARGTRLTIEVCVCIGWTEKASSRPLNFAHPPQLIPLQIQHPRHSGEGVTITHNACFSTSSPFISASTSRNSRFALVFFAIGFRLLTNTTPAIYGMGQLRQNIRPPRLWAPDARHTRALCEPTH